MNINKMEQKNKPKIRFGKISSSTLKNLGFKSKAIAKTFSKLSNVNTTEYINDQDFLKALKNKLNNFKKIRIRF